MEHITVPEAGSQPVRENTPPAATEGTTPPAVPAATAADRFLVAFARLEEALRRVLGANSKESFRWMVRQASKRNAMVKAVEEDLIEYADLRNAIVHERGGGYVIAEPHASTVERLERIVALVLDPPTIDQVMSRPVATCGPDDPIALAARRMVDGDFSRLPVYAEGELLGLLTANAIARWVAARLADGDGALRDEPVRRILTFGEAGRRFELVPPDCLVADAVRLFTQATEKGRRLEAVLVTRSGSATERPLGIVTLQDLPRVFQLIDEG